MVSKKLDNQCARFRTSKHVTRDYYSSSRPVSDGVEETGQSGDLKEDLMMHVLIKDMDNELMASDVGSARSSTTLQRCAGKGCRVQLVEKESSTPEEVVLLIPVEKVSKKPAGTGALPSRCEDPDNCVSTGHCNVLAWSDYPKLGNLPVQENGTTPTMYGGTVRKSLGGGGGGQSNRRRGHGWSLKTKHQTLLPLDTCLPDTQTEID